jgi:hypothetical protein
LVVLVLTPKELLNGYICRPWLHDRNAAQTQPLFQAELGHEERQHRDQHESYDNHDRSIIRTTINTASYFPRPSLDLPLIADIRCLAFRQPWKLQSTRQANQALFPEGRCMHIPILIEPGPAGGFCARAGAPFGVSAEGPTATAAAEHLATLLRDRLKAGAQLAFLDLGNGPQVLPQAPLHLEPLPDDDWFFRTMREAIAENRHKEDEANG